MPTLLWWGRSDTRYSRNQIILKLFEKLGWKVAAFHPVSSALGKVQAYFSRPALPDLIWVPCFRQRDMHSAVHWAKKWRCPLVFDPLISAYQKEVFERRKWPQNDKAAVQLREWEATWFQHADVVIADTKVHADYFIRTFRLDPQKVFIIHVGADERMFNPTPLDVEGMPLEVLFYGSFLPLHGPEVIVDAASLSKDLRVQWVLLGDGDSKNRIQDRARGLENVRFEPWMDYANLPRRLSRAHMVLGIFGTTPKASMVIPNKVFQTMAAGRPLITMRSDAYPKKMSASQVIGWVPPGDPQALSQCVAQWAAAPQQLVARGVQTRNLFDEFFSADQLLVELQKALGVALRVIP